jgi:glutathione synthase/RimK-type ligase-like ATP-grasp enzyme
VYRVLLFGVATLHADSTSSHSSIRKTINGKRKTQMTMARIKFLVLIWCLAPCAESLFGFTSRSLTSVRPQVSTTSRLRAGAESAAADDDEDDGEMDPVILFEGGRTDEKPTRAIILMDCFCEYHGMYMGFRAQQMGIAVIPLLSSYLYDFLMATHPEDAEQHRRIRIPSKDKMKAWMKRLPPLEIVGVYCESDSGLADAESLRKALNVSCRDDPDELEARRNKYLMHEMIKEDPSMPVLRQNLCQTLSEAQFFAQSLFESGHQYVVIKPYRGVASEGVQLCRNSDEVAQAFEKIHGSAVFGSKDRHESVLLQEFLEGPEYAIDVVSRNGDHKIAAVWRYDKRPANGASFCYFQTRLVDPTVDSNVETICSYIKNILHRLGIKYGISHNEVVLTKNRGPMLIEVNCRQHNMDFAPITMACIGYNALDMTLCAFFGDDEDWEQFPDQPVLLGHGCMVHLVNFAEGTLKNVKFLNETRRLKSFLDGQIYEYFLTPGEEIKPTVDIRSDAGWVQLINQDEKELDKDYKKIVEWMPSMFEVE